MTDSLKSLLIIVAVTAVILAIAVVLVKTDRGGDR